MAESARIDQNTVVLPGKVRVRFMRTLRLPETGTHPLPPGLGEFPVRAVADYPQSAPPEWLRRGGVMLPVYLREAMWLSFGVDSGEPAALQVGVGKVCAVSGRPWSDTLDRSPQNYLTLPRQPWLDGINSGKGTVRQFVAVPLGMGATVEGQLTGEETWGGLQLQSFTLRPPVLDAWRAEEAARRAELARGAVEFGGWGAAPPPAPGGAAPMAAAGAAMGMGAGGTMRQEVYEDERPPTDWESSAAGRVFVHLVTPPQWRLITGEEPPPSPVDRAAYTRAGLPWYDYYDESGTDLAPSDGLASVKPVGEWLGEDHTPWQQPSPHQVKPLGDAPGKPVSDGDW
ncbi:MULTISPECIES: hypothetical protein [Streptomyces]|uniref:Integral membrane protein n=1 Tax=Streptomyces albus (strain ATCC 21838 / DSM 41398 / FERM P-419 / JCM 4703 / NBRC 107858) TaxID=1081613 RepID=A0A0B5EXX4_STRA4|nr:hypothetical protein [Streptomyces sp. SCSIO ZS0520]AJE87648.1 integral membrane protein [Streptomyces albus]AOU81948.1 integral membrane protein [Streptomyces albus]